MPTVLTDHSAEYTQAQADYTAKHADTLAAEATEKAEAGKLATLQSRLASTRKEYAGLTAAMLQAVIDGLPIDASKLGVLKSNAEFLAQAIHWHQTFALNQATETKLSATLAESRAKYAATVARKKQAEYQLIKSLSGVVAASGGIQLAGHGDIARQHEQLIRECLNEIDAASRALASHREAAATARAEYYARYGDIK